MSPGAARRAAAGRAGRRASRATSRGSTSCPASLFFVLFTFAPLLHTAWLSFFDWDGLTVGKWVGLDNYRKALSDPDVRASFVHALS